MGVEQVPPAPVAQLGGPLGRADDVGEQHRGQHTGRFDAAASPDQELLDHSQHHVLLVPPHRQVALQLHQPRVGDVLGQVAAVRGRHQLEVAVVEHQRWHLDQRQQGADVDLQHRPQVGADHPRAGDGPLEPGRPAPEPLVVGVARRVGLGVGLGAPQLPGAVDHRLDGLGREPDRVVVGDQVPGGGVGQDQRAGPLRPGPGEEQRHRAGLGPFASSAARREPAADSTASSSSV